MVRGLYILRYSVSALTIVQSRSSTARSAVSDASGAARYLSTSTVLDLGDVLART